MSEDARLIAITERLGNGDYRDREDFGADGIETGAGAIAILIQLLAARDQQITQLQRELDIANVMLVGEKGLLNERMLAVAAVEHDYVQKLELKNEQIASLQQQLEKQANRIENLKFDMNLVGAQLGISKREEVEGAVRGLLARAEKAEAALTEARQQLELNQRAKDAD